VLRVGTMAGVVTSGSVEVRHAETDETMSSNCCLSNTPGDADSVGDTDSVEAGRAIVAFDVLMVGAAFSCACVARSCLSFFGSRADQSCAPLLPTHPARFRHPPCLHTHAQMPKHGVSPRTLCWCHTRALWALGSTGGRGEGRGVT